MSSCWSSRKPCFIRTLEVCRKLNVTGDPESERLTAEVQVPLLIDPEGPRQSEGIRTETARKAAEIAERTDGYNC